MRKGADGTTVDQYGFAIRDRSDRRYAWEAICSIGIIAYAANASKDIYQTEICIFLEPFGDKDLRKLRDSYLYGAFNLKRFVLLDNDPRLIDALTKCSGLPNRISNLRRCSYNMRAYVLTSKLRLTNVPALYRRG